MWLAPLGSPQGGLCRRMLTLEKTLESAISRAVPCSPGDGQQRAVNTDSPCNSWLACIVDEIK